MEIVGALYLVSGTWFIDSGHPNVCTRKGGDHYVLPSNSVANNDIHTWLLPVAAVGKLHSKSTP